MFSNKWDIDKAVFTCVPLGDAVLTVVGGRDCLESSNLLSVPLVVIPSRTWHRSENARLVIVIRLRSFLLCEVGPS